MPNIHNKGATMRILVISKLVVFAAIMAPPVYGHVLMPMSYAQRKAASRTIVIAETVPRGSRPGILEDIVEFKVLATLKGQASSSLKVSRSTMIDEEKLMCCREQGRFILFLRKGRNGLYESVNGDYGVVRLAE